VQLDKQQILDFLRSQGRDHQVQQADQDLPQQVDTDQHADLLQRLGIHPQDLIAKFAGGEGLGGLLGGDR
jgi:hypothetical protein